MKFYFDENFPRAACQLLEQFGHEWLDHRDSQFKGSSDADLMSEVRRNGAILLTTDRDFYHTWGFHLSADIGIVVIALKQPNRAAIVSRLEWLLNNVPAAELLGRAFQLRDSSWLARPPLGTFG